MKLTIPTNTLKSVLNAMKPFIRREVGTSTLPSLHLLAENGLLTVRGGTSVSAVRITRDAEVALRGMAVVPFELLRELSNALPEEITLLEKRDKKLFVESGAVHLDLTVMEEDWDPGFVADLPGFVGARELREALGMVEPFASRAEHTGIFRGVQFDFREEGAALAASDTFRLAIARLQEAGGFAAKVVVMREQAAALAKVFTEDETLAFGADDAYLYVGGERATAKVALMTGEFPDLEARVPKRETLTRSVRMDAQALASALRRAYILASSVDNNRVDLNIEPGRVTVVGENPFGTLEEALDATPALHNAPEPFRMAVNTKYLLDALKPIRETVQLGAQAAPNAPVMVAPVDSDAFVAIVAPLHLAAKDPQVAAREAEQRERQAREEAAGAPAMRA